MPSASRLAIIEDPPTEIKGRGIPLTGSVPRFIPMLAMI